jgi:HEAT repeat protein
LAVAFAPAAMLGIAAAHLHGPARAVSIGLGVTLAVEALFVFTKVGSKRSVGGLLTVAFFAVAALCLRFNSPNMDWSGTHLMLAASILCGVGLIVRNELTTTSGNARRIKFLISKLVVRKDWPATFEEYRTCPQIQSLREGLGDNAAGVLPLLAHDDIRVQMAALTAIEFFPTWRKDQVEVILQRAAYTDQPVVRAAALLALANVVKSRHVLALLPYLTDGSEVVRRSAAIAVLWDAPGRWTEIRGYIRGALAAPHAAKDGPLPCSGSLPPMALEDLVNWAAESGPVGKRSTATLIRHCKKAIHEDGSQMAIDRVSSFVANPKIPAAIRVELAHRLQSADVFPVNMAVTLLGPTNPTMLRVLAAGAILSHTEDHQAVEVLREAAKQPNREITLAAAGLVQKYLGVDLGLAVGVQLPATNSREAAEITRRVQKWAADPGSQVDAETPPEALEVAEDVAYF